MQSGLGSSASISTAVAKSLTAYLGCKLTNNDISNIVYKTEGLQHGNPSGIDNLVVAHATPILFSKLIPPTYLMPSKPLHYVLAHSGEHSKTRDTVQLIATQRITNPQFNSTINKIGHLSVKGAVAFAIGDSDSLGALMTTNHNLLQKLCVSSNRLDLLVSAAIEAGASGAKLSGAGRGGHIVAQVTETSTASVVTALQKLGANPFVTTITPQLHDH
jgi:mevalonate kinase